MDVSKIIPGTGHFNENYEKLTEYIPEELKSKFEFIETSIAYNNEVEVKKWSGKILDVFNCDLITEDNFMWESHLRELGKDKVDLLILKNFSKDYDRVSDFLDSMKNSYVKVGLMDPSIIEIKDAKYSLGRNPDYVMIEINQGYFDRELINFCMENYVKIIGYGVLGGPAMSSNHIYRYTLPYIISSATRYTDYIILEWGNIAQLEDVLNVPDSIDIPQMDNKVRATSTYSYCTQIYSLRDSDGFPIYEKYEVNRVHRIDSIKTLPTQAQWISEFKCINNNVKFGSIGEVKAFLRYSNIKSRVAIIDRYGIPVSKFTSGCKIIINEKNY